jgi:hypothetical protein
LLDCHLDENRVFSDLRKRYSNSFPDFEISDIICWWQNHRSQHPHGYHRNNSQSTRRSKLARALTNAERIANAQRFCRGDWIEPEDVEDRSPIRLEENFREDSISLLENLYEPHEWICINSRFRVFGKDGEKKYVPSGAGITKRIKDWIEWFAHNQMPDQPAGCWQRMNGLRAPW